VESANFGVYFHGLFRVATHGEVTFCSEFWGLDDRPVEKEFSIEPKNGPLGIPEICLFRLLREL
jgi:hypothetical protein